MFPKLQYIENNDYTDSEPFFSDPKNQIVKQLVSQLEKTKFTNSEQPVRKLQHIENYDDKNYPQLGGELNIINNNINSICNQDFLLTKMPLKLFLTCIDLYEVLG